MKVLVQVPQLPAPVAPPQMDTFDARDLIKQGTRACIMLDGQPYFLRITRAGKLILTK